MIFSRLKHWFKMRRAGINISQLREFVYLDEVSLRSLLSSQKGEVTDTTSEQRLRGEISEFGGSIGLALPPLSKNELTSKFQTSNSSTLQTSRKATVQSWFREFHSIPNIRLIEPRDPDSKPSTVRELLNIKDLSILANADSLMRGSVVEFKVELTADPVFHIGTIVSEFSGMAADSPELFADNNAATTIDQLKPMQKALQRLLAGLIPIRAKSVDYSVIVNNGIEYIAHNSVLKCINIPCSPLEIVGVTEHLAYWKDIRRVLFSKAEFTMLCRIGRSGLHDSWTPVKLADLFNPLSPGLIDQINTASQEPFRPNQTTSQSINTNELLLGRALNMFKMSALSDTDINLSEENEAELEQTIKELKLRAKTVSGQRSAFYEFEKKLKSLTKVEIDSEKSLKLREESRSISGLPLFPTLSSTDTTIIQETNSDKKTIPIPPRLLDVEVIAIYW